MHLPRNFAGEPVKYYNLDAVISVDYRVNSVRATQFRQWCTNVLRQFAIRGYVIHNNTLTFIMSSLIPRTKRLLKSGRFFCPHRQRFSRKCLILLAPSRIIGTSSVKASLT